MPRTSAAHASEMRERILDGAHRVMLAGGYRGTTMPAIAAEADVSVGLLYRYFESKEELYLAMCESVTQAQLDELAVQISQITDARERLGRAVGHFVDSLDTEHWGAIITTGWAEAIAAGITAVAAFRLPLLGTIAVGVISVVVLRNLL